MTPFLERDGITLYNAEALATLQVLPSESVDAVVTDPPYSSGGMFRADRVGLSARDKYQMTNSNAEYSDFGGDNRDQRAYGYWSALWMSEALRVTKPHGAIALFTDWRQLPTTTDALQAGGWIWRGLAVWDKTEAARPMKGRYRNQCEYVVWGSKGPLADEGPCLPGVFRHFLKKDDKHHLTGKPTDVMRAVLGIAWRDKSIVLDPFAGSGTTLVAARDIGLRAIGIEIERKYCEVAARRLSQTVLPLAVESSPPPKP